MSGNAFKHTIMHIKHKASFPPTPTHPPIHKGTKQEDKNMM